MYSTNVHSTTAELNLDSLTDQIHSAQTSDDIWNVLTSYLSSYGLDRITYLFARLDAPYDDPVAMTNLPAWWSDVFLDADNIAADPLFRFCGTFKARLTGIDYLDNYPPLNRSERDRIEAAADAGCRTGMASPVRLIGNRRCGGWNFGSSLARCEFEKLYPRVKDQLQLVGFHAHERLQTLRVQQPCELDGFQHQSLLSRREQECLSFLAAGSRTSRIATLLGVSAATVEFHLKNVKRKLGASTREEALAKAITQGQIVIS
ncbi:MAG: LuxR C-terminal-related transcriptional regulator [Pseudomonadota bacterium]